MSDRATRNGKALSLMIVALMALGGLLAVALSAAPAAEAATCSQQGGFISGNWIINTAQVCSNIDYTVDGSVYIVAGGSLTLQNGGLSFAKDQSHTGYFLTVYGGGSLTLDNSTVTAQTNLINPYLLLNVSVSSGSSMVLTNGAMLKFPGWLNTTGATFTMTHSFVRGFTDQELSGVFAASGQLDASDDAPVINWAGTNAYLYHSALTMLYEPNVTKTGAALPLSLTGGSNLYSYDSYIGIDYSDVSYEHNTLFLTGTSHAYLYNLTIDLSQSPPSLSNYLPAFSFGDGTSAANLLRWVHATVTDSAGEAVGNAKIWSRQSPSTATATFPETGTTTPSATTLAYLGGKTAGNWNATSATGQVLIPLWTDTVNQASLPNANSFGSYTETATYSIYNAVGGVSFPPYPSLSSAENNIYTTLALNTAPICSSPVVTWSSIQFTGSISLGSSVLVTGAATLTDASVYLEQSATACAYIMVSSTGSLTLVNSTISSNYPMVLAVAGGSLTVRSGSTLALSANGGYGLLRSNASGVVNVLDSKINANVALVGGTTSLLRDTFLGPQLYLNTTAQVKLYDADLSGVQTISLLTDLGAPNIAFDIRNVTFSSGLTPQIVFRGNQNVQFTSVAIYDPSGTWYLTMVTANAVVSRYWWLTINDVDGTGTLLSGANATVLVRKIDQSTLQPVPAPNPVPGNTIYFTSSTTWPVEAPAGMVLYRAFQDSWRAGGSHTVDDSYLIGGSASVQGNTYYPDANASSNVSANAGLNLMFSSLTPDFSVASVTFAGGNGALDLQPLNRPLQITATIQNAGQIAVRNVKVDFFSVNVDSNGDGIMDSPVSAYEAAGVLINETVIPVIQGGSTAQASTVWTPEGSFETSMTVSVVVNPPVGDTLGPSAIPETNLRNNIKPAIISLFTWPDLAITGSSDVSFPVDPVVNNDVPVNVAVHNLGTASATSARLAILEGNNYVSNNVTFSVGIGQIANLVVLWHPRSTGSHSITITVTTQNNTVRNDDYDYSNNWITLQKNVLSQPDLAVLDRDYSVLNVSQNQPFSILVRIYNLGQTAVQNTSVAVYLNHNYSFAYGRVDDIPVLRETNVSVQVRGIPTPSSPGSPESLTVVVNPDHTLIEGGGGFSNDYANITVNVLPPSGGVVLALPTAAATFGPTDTILVQGVVRDKTPSQNGIAGLRVSIALLNSNNQVMQGPYNTTTDSNGLFQWTLSLNNLPDGTYTLQVSSSSGITTWSQSLIVKRNVPFLDQPVPLLGLPWFLFLIILAAVAAIVIGVTVYFKVYGLGKMVECGECGAFIPEDATVCPKCGVEFEKDMAKCSNCQAWIPVDVKQCPECGVEFATGEVEMADYQEKMRLQYDEVVQKFKEDAARQLGRSLSDKEFQEWWRKQPTFLTFEDWLREEEEMRKMGSRPCPVCGTLNSVTATVCHKCGSLMKEQRPPSGGTGTGGMAPAVKQRAATPTTPPPSEPQGGMQAAPAGGQEVVPRRVIRKPITPTPLIQKKVIKRPASEGEQGGSTEGGDQSGDSTQEDEL